jgi:hypothetical protein
MRKNINKYEGFVNPVHLVNPINTGFILPAYLEGYNYKRYDSIHSSPDT